MITIELFTIFASIAALFIPFAAKYFEQNSKLKKAIYLKELIKTKEELEDILHKKTDPETQPILHSKLKEIVNDIEDEISRGDDKNLNLYLISIVSFIIIYVTSINEYSSLAGFSRGVSEGIFSQTIVKIISSFFLLIISYVSLNIISKKLSINNTFLTLAMFVAIFAIVFIAFLIFLTSVDKLTHLF